MELNKRRTALKESLVYDEMTVIRAFMNRFMNKKMN